MILFFLIINISLKNNFLLYNFFHDKKNYSPFKIIKSLYKNLKNARFFREKIVIFIIKYNWSIIFL